MQEPIVNPVNQRCHVGELVQRFDRVAVDYALRSRVSQLRLAALLGLGKQYRL
jgi:hypothetical protein